MNEELKRVEYIDEHGENLTSWECDFLDSVLKTLRTGCPMTERQRVVFDRIEEERLP